MTTPTQETVEQEYYYQTDQQVSVNGFIDVDIDGETVRLQVTTRYGATPDKVVKTTDAQIEAYRILRAMHPKPAAEPMPQAPAAEPVRVQIHDENGLPIVNPEGEPITEAVVGAKVYTVEGVAHGKTQAGKDTLIVWTVEREEFLNRKWGTKCFHAPEAYRDFKTWAVDAKYAPKPGAMHVVIRAPEEGSKYPEVVEFRA